MFCPFFFLFIHHKCNMTWRTLSFAKPATNNQPNWVQREISRKWSNYCPGYSYFIHSSRHPPITYLTSYTHKYIQNMCMAKWRPDGWMLTGRTYLFPNVFQCTAFILTLLHAMHNAHSTQYFITNLMLLKMEAAPSVATPVQIRWKFAGENCQSFSISFFSCYSIFSLFFFSWSRMERCRSHACDEYWSVRGLQFPIQCVCVCQCVVYMSIITAKTTMKHEAIFHKSQLKVIGTPQGRRRQPEHCRKCVIIFHNSTITAPGFVG